MNDKAFALAMRPAGGGPWQFLSDAASGGNLMRTISPFHARTWPTAAEAGAWVDAHGDGADRVLLKLCEKTKAEKLKVQVVTTEWSVVPLALAVCPPSRTLKLRSIEPKDRTAAEHESEYHLS